MENIRYEILDRESSLKGELGVFIWLLPILNSNFIDLWSKSIFALGESMEHMEMTHNGGIIFFQLKLGEEDAPNLF